MSYTPVEFSAITGIGELAIDQALAAYFRQVLAAASITAKVSAPWVPAGTGLRVRVSFASFDEEPDDAAEWGEGSGDLSVVLSGTDTVQLDALRHAIRSDLGSKSWSALGVVRAERTSELATLTDVNDHEVDMRWTVGRRDPERAFT